MIVISESYFYTCKLVSVCIKTILFEKCAFLYNIISVYYLSVSLMYFLKTQKCYN